MPTNKLPQHLHRKIWQILWWKSQGTLQSPSPIHLHSTTTGHPMDPEQFSIVHKEVNSQSRTMKEAMFIWIQDPTLNRNLGKYQLPHIWDQLLMASPTLQCTPSSIPTTSPTPNPPPYWCPPPPATHTGGGTYFYGTYTHLAKLHPIHPQTIKTTPPLQQCHLGKFLIFVRLTFLSDLMKWLQYGCQQKLIIMLLMFSLCFSSTSFIYY